MNDMENTEKNLLDNQQEVGSYRTNSFFELFNNQNCIKNDFKKITIKSDSSKQRDSNIDDDINFDDLDDIQEKIKAESSSDSNTEPDNNDIEDEEELDKFDEIDNSNEDKLNSIPINRFRKIRRNSKTISEEIYGSSFKQCAKSLPVNIPNWKPFHNRRATEDNDTEWFSFKDNPQGIAESIKALARSVRDGTEIFGDLPCRRFNASEMVRNHPI